MLRSRPFAVWLSDLADTWVSEPLDSFCDWVDLCLGLEEDWGTSRREAVPQAQEITIPWNSEPHRRWMLRYDRKTLDQRIALRDEMAKLRGDRAVSRILLKGNRFEVIFRDGYSMPVNPELQHLKWDRRPYG